MLKNRIIVLLTAVSLMISSCTSANPVSDKNKETISMSSNAGELPYYMAEKINITDEDGLVSGVEDGEIILDKYQWKYNLNCGLSDNPEVTLEFPFDLNGVFRLKEKDNIVYCYGFDSNDNYKTIAFSSDLKEIFEIPDTEKSVYCFSPDNSENVLICSADEKNVYFKKYNVYGECVESKEYDNSIFEGENIMYPGDIVYTEKENIFFLYENDIGAHLCKMNDSFDIISDIQCENFLDMEFTGAGENTYIRNYEYEDNVYSFYRINEYDDSLEYAGSLNGSDRIISGTAGYDCFYYINSDLYGYRIEDEKSERITEGLSADYVWSDNMDMYLAFSEEIFVDEVFGMKNDGTLRNINSCEESDFSLYNKICYPGHFQIVHNPDENISVYDISLGSGEYNRIDIVTENDKIIADILVNSSDILINMLDMNTGFSCISLYDRDGNEKTSISDVINITEMLTMSDESYFIAGCDELTEKVSLSVLNSESGILTPVVLKGMGSDENIVDFFSDYEKNAVYVMSEKYIYSGIPDNNVLSLEKIIDIENTSLESCNSIREFYADSGDYYVQNENGLFVLRETEAPVNNNNELKVLCVDCDYDDAITAAYKSLYPELKIKYIKLDSAEEDINERVNMMISSGDIPDIVISNDSEFCDFSISRDNDKNAYADLYTLIENDTEYDIADFQESILKSMEFDGHLYQITPAFTLKTVLADVEKFNYDEGWSISDFTEVVSLNDTAFICTDSAEVADAALNLMAFYDYKNSKAYFNTNNFKNLMELIKILPDLSELNEDFVLYNAELNSFSDENYIKKCYFGGREIVNAGCPGIGGNGVIIMPFMQFSVYSQSKHKSEAWNYIKMYFTEEYFNSNYSYRFPVRKSLLEKYADDARHPDTEDEFALTGYDLNKNSVNLGIPDDMSVSFIQNLIDDATTLYRCDSRIYHIFNENYSEYSEGAMDIEEFSEKIQKKAEIYLSER